jgi:hypothetical protein
MQSKNNRITTSDRRFIQNILVKLLGVKRFEAIKRSPAYKFTVEAFTMNIFSLLITAPNELLIAGMDVDEFVKTRLSSMVINTITGRPYGVWRDWFLDRLRIKKDSHLFKKYLGDTLAFMGFQLPLYWLSMTIASAELDEMIKASIPLTVISGLTGRPYGFCLDKFRFYCGLSSKTT